MRLSIYIPLDRKSQKSNKKRTKKTNRAQNSTQKSNEAQKSTQKSKFTQKSTKNSNELKIELKKVKSNGHLTQKRTQKSFQKVLNKVRSFKKVLKKVNLLKKGFKNLIFLKKSEFNEEEKSNFFSLFFFKKCVGGVHYKILYLEFVFN